MISTKSRITKEEQQSVRIQSLMLRTMNIAIVGNSPLIINAFGPKAQEQMLGKQMGKTIQKTKKDPDFDYEQATYYLDKNGFEIPYSDKRKDIKKPIFGFPSTGPKQCAIRGAKHIDGIAMTDMRGGFDIDTVFIRIQGDRFMRQDTVRLASGVADIRFRPCWNQWWSEFSVTYNERIVTPDLIVNMFNQGGFGCGIGEWRPGSPRKPGPYGKFHVASDEELKVLKGK